MAAVGYRLTAGAADDVDGKLGVDPSTLTTGHGRIELYMVKTIDGVEDLKDHNVFAPAGTKKRWDMVRAFWGAALL